MHTSKDAASLNFLHYILSTLDDDEEATGTGLWYW